MAELKVFRFKRGESMKHENVGIPAEMFIFCTNEKNARDRVREIWADHWVVFSEQEWVMTEHEISEWQYFIVNQPK